MITMIFNNSYDLLLLLHIIITSICETYGKRAVIDISKCTSHCKLHFASFTYLYACIDCTKN